MILTLDQTLLLILFNFSNTAEDQGKWLEIKNILGKFDHLEAACVDQHKDKARIWFNIASLDVLITLVSNMKDPV